MTIKKMLRPSKKQQICIFEHSPFCSYTITGDSPFFYLSFIFVFVLFHITFGDKLGKTGNLEPYPGPCRGKARAPARGSALSSTAGTTNHHQVDPGQAPHNASSWLKHKQ